MRTRLITTTACVAGLIGFVAFCALAEGFTWGAAATVAGAAGFIALHRNSIKTNESNEA